FSARTFETRRSISSISMRRLIPKRTTTCCFASRKVTEEYKELSSEISWSCHLANVECPAAIDLGIDYDFVSQPEFLEVSVIHIGWSVYFIVVFDILNLIVLVVLARSAGIQDLASWLQLLLFALAIAFSIATAEI